MNEIDDYVFEVKDGAEAEKLVAEWSLKEAGLFGVRAGGSWKVIAFDDGGWFLCDDDVDGYRSPRYASISEMFNGESWLSGGAAIKIPVNE